MPSINMIAARRAEKKRLEKLTYVIGLVILGQLLVLLFIFGFMTTCIYGAGREVKRLDKDLAKLQPTVEKIHNYESEINKLQPKLSLLTESGERTLKWYTILQDLSRSIPESTWLSSVMTIKPDPNGTAAVEGSSDMTVNVTGISASQRLVGELMLRLNQYPEFERVDLKYTQNGTVGNHSTVEFQVAAMVKGNDRQKGGAQKDVQN